MWSARTRILLIDEHRLFGECLRKAIRAIGDVTIASTLRDAGVAMETLPRFDLILLDLKLPDGDGFRLFPYLEKLKDPPPVLILSGQNLPGELDQSRKMGAKGYLNKRCETDEMLRALDLIINHDGEYWPSTGGNSVSNGAMRLGITPRQLEVLQLVAKGYSNREIGEELGITEATVKSHLTALFQALDVKNRNACVFSARQIGLIH